MHLIVIAWLYVTILMAATEPSLVGGLLTFCLYGLLPLAILVYLFGHRRKRSVGMPVRQLADRPDRGDSKPDQ
jgi:MYXO-CTERM domain-containing protein